MASNRVPIYSYLIVFGKLYCLIITQKHKKRIFLLSICYVNDRKVLSILSHISAKNFIVITKSFELYSKCFKLK